MRALGFDPVGDTQETFRAMVDAMARPGTVQAVPAEPADHAVAVTLVDNEVTFHTRDETLASALEAANRLTPAPASEADIVHLKGDRPQALRDASRGTLKEPSDGATIIYRVGAIHDTAREGHVGLRLRGPGVPDERSLGLDGVSADVLDATADANAAFPRGVEVLVTAEQTIAAVPRSATLEVV